VVDGKVLQAATAAKKGNYTSKIAVLFSLRKNFTFFVPHFPLTAKKTKPRQPELPGLNVSF
jgi:hypothetical protein